MAQRDAPVGGQAVLEGVMMRGVSTWAVAVRKPPPEQLESEERLDPREGATGEIEVQSFPLVSVLKRHRLLRLPIVRGVVALGESLAIGFKALGISANAQLAEERGGDRRRACGRARSWSRSRSPSACSSCSRSASRACSRTSCRTRRPVRGSSRGVLRIAIFLGYLVLLSRMRDLRRVFEYHGAEHKTISCYEAGLPLTPGERAALLAAAPALRDELPARS